MLKIRELTTEAIITRLLVATILGGILGMERGLKNRPAGFRTYILVCLGACMVMMTNQYIYQVFNAGDPVRMGAQVVSGIGFLGAGTIIVTHHRQIKGLTTAAGLWASACMGLAIGVGFYEVAVFGCIFMLISFTLLHRLDSFMRNRSRMMDVYIEIKKDYPIKDFIKYLNERKIDINIIQMERDVAIESSASALVITLFSQKKISKHSDIISTLKECDGVKYFEIL